MTDRPTLPTMMELRMAAAREMGFEVEILDPESGYLFELRRGSFRKVLVGAFSPLNDAAAYLLATDKFHTVTLVQRAGFRVPPTARCLRPGWFLEEDFRPHTGMARAEELARQEGFPLLVKPNRGSRGKGISTVEDVASLRRAVEGVWERDYLALVQGVIPGMDVRLDFLDGEYLLGYARRPAILEGNGESSVRELLSAEDVRFRVPAFAERAARDPLWRRKAPSTTLDTVLSEGERLEFHTPVLNLNRLCFAEPIDPLPEPWLKACRTIAATLGLRHYGIDFKAPSFEAGPEAATVIEVNASPSVVQMARMGHYEWALQAERKVLEAILEGGLH